MPLNKLENFIKNYEGRILYVNSNDLDATDSITNAGNSLTKPFKTIQRALIEAARFSFITGNDNDRNDRTTILVFPGEHVIDNRPGYGIRKTGTSTAEVETPSGQIITPAADAFNLTLESNFDLTQEDNVLYKFNSIHGGVILPRGTSLVGLDLRKTKIRPKYVPNPTDDSVPASSIFKITGNCYFWQFSLFDADESGLVYTNNKIFSAGSGNLSTPTFSHHKLTCFEYADGVNVPEGYGITDLDMYYAKLSNAFNEGSGKQIPSAQKFPLAPRAFAKERPEWEIVGSFATDPVLISNIISGDGATPSPVVTVTTQTEHGLTAGTPIKIRGVNVNDYNVSTVVQSVPDNFTFTYLLGFVRNDLSANPGGSASVTIETDTVKGASPYIFNCSLRSVWGMNGMKADGRKASGFKSMVVAQFTAVSLQKDDRAFVKYDPITRTYNGIPISKTTGAQLSSQSASTITETVYHLDPNAIYRKGWEPSHIKITNDSFIQVVSVFAIGFNKHFDAQSGGDGSITNSNSNFGQFSLHSDGFKKEAFTKDDHGYITSIITPKYVKPTEQNIDWISVDVGLTTAVGLSSHLYLYGFNTRDNVPPNLIQGYRVGARADDVLYLDLPDGTTVSANILMTDSVVSTAVTTLSGANSSVKEYTVSSTTTAPNYDTLTTSSTHNLQTGEKIIIISDDADLPENLTENKIYYTIRVSATELKVASSFTNAQNGLAITMYGGTRLRILSRVSDRDAGELGSPIQYDVNRGNWFIYVNKNNQIYTSISNLGVSGFNEPRTDVTYFKRIEDSRSLDEKIYKVRIVVPKEAVNAKDPTDGFVLQESSSTGAISNSEFSLTNITASNYNYKRNYRFISTCSAASGTVTVVAELPHNLNVGDRVLIKNVKSTTNLTGVGVTGYNGDFTVTGVTNDKTFTYSTTDVDGSTHNVGIFSGPTARDTSLPRFERNDLQSNFYLYRTETLSPYIYNVQDGIYHAYLLKADNAIPDHFTSYKYTQNIVDLYPQQDRDNLNDNPHPAVSFAKRSPLGDVVTNDLKKSITRETVNALVKKVGAAPTISGVSPTVSGICTITTALEHGLNGIVGYSTLSGGSGYTAGTYYNVRLLNSDDAWNGATAKVVVSGAGNSITSAEIMAGGAGYASTTLKFAGFSGATLGITTLSISRAENNSVQITGLGTASDGLFRIVSVPSNNTIAVARTSGDPEITIGQFVFNVAPAIEITSVIYNSTAGISTITCVGAHGLVAGNKFRIIDGSSNNLGDHVVNDTIGIHTFTVATGVNTTSGHRVLKHGLSSNDLTSAAGEENLGARGVPFYDNETAILQSDISSSTSGISTVPIKVSNSGISTTTRFPIGSYIQINNEIMRVASSTLSGSGNNEITVLRGVLGTQKENHLAYSLVKKIRPIPVELRRPSILRASGHTFEYLGYGPGNYSTGLPQIQARTLSERADFLSQSQERSCGSVVYTGMNSDGDFFIGNTKYSSASGEQTTFDIPIPTITGQDPSRLSAVFDEVIVKERILVEGGKSKKVLSQFDGPVTFNENIIINNDQTKVNGDLISSDIVRLNDQTESTSVTTGVLVTKGGVGIAKNLNVGGSVNIAGITTFSNEVSFNSGLVPDAFEDAYIGSASKPWASAWIGGIGIATEGVPGGTEVQDRTINAWTGDLVLTSTVGIVSVTDKLEVTDDLLVKGNTILTGIATVNTGLVPDVDKGAYLGTEGRAFEEAFIDGITVGVGSTTRISTRGGGLTLDSSSGFTTIDDNLHVVNNLRISGVSTFIGVSTFSGGAEIDNIRLGIQNNNTIDTSAGDLTLDAFTDTVIISPNLSVSGVSTFTGLLDANGGATIDNIRIGVAGDNEIDTSTGNLTIDSSGGTTTLDDNVSISGTLGVTDTSTFSSNVNIQGSSKTFAVKNNAGTTQFSVGSDSGTTSILGKVSISETTDATTATFSSSSAAFRVAGGASIEKKLFVGSDLSIGGNTTFSGTFGVSGNFAVNTNKFNVAATTGNTTVAGTLDVAGKIDGNNGIDISGAESVFSSATVSDLTSGRVVYAGTSGSLVDSSNLTFDGSNLYAGGELRAGGDIIAYYSSDRRLKTDITTIDNALDKISSISGVTFNWNELAENKDPLIREAGVIAQEIQKVLPEVVTERDNGYLAVKYDKIVPLLIEAIKELKEKVENLEKKLG